MSRSVNLTSELMSRSEDGTPDLIATFLWSGSGPVRVHGHGRRGERYALELVAEGIPGPNFEHLTLEDGEAFIRALPHAFRGSRLWATPVVDITPRGR